MFLVGVEKPKKRSVRLISYDDELCRDDEHEYYGKSKSCL